MYSAFDAFDSDVISRCLRDTVALSTLPAMWFGAEPLRIAESLAAALFTTLVPQFVCVVWKEGQGAPKAILQTGRYETDPELAEKLAPAVLARAQASDPDEILELPDPRTSELLKIILRPVGHLGEFGVIAAAFADASPLTDLHHLLLNVAATQAASAFQSMRLMTSLREESRALESLNRTGALLAAQLDLQSIVQTVTDAGVEISGAQFGAFFYNVENEAGESFMLHTLSGADKAAFEEFSNPRATEFFGPTFRGEGIVRSADITADPRFGRSAPWHGLPPGHLPVRSYLAIPVTSRSGEVIGGLFFGHARSDVFNERAERILVGLAGQAAVAIDNARLFQTAAQARQGLEERVQERTRELEKVYDVLHQAQKMEAIGQLTGGVAHDFNNLLMVIKGSADLLRLPNLTEERRARYVAAVSETADKAARLTQQLLAFARRQALAPQVFDAVERIHAMTDMLKTVLGSHCDFTLEGEGAHCLVLADPAHFDSAIVNLVVNARDSMGANGSLKIRIRPGKPQAGQKSTEIEIIDTGCGIPPEDLGKIFDPFFTTKEVGKGTGLGLSQVYGFVQQSGGHIDVTSQLGKGTVFKIRLPSSEAAQARLRGEAAPSRVRLTGRVLLVEDNQSVRDMAQQLLTEIGFDTTAARSAMDALDLLERDLEAFDLVFSDVVMPGMSGVELGKRIRQLKPDLPVILTSGYSRVLVDETQHGFPLLQKPYSLEGLARILADVVVETGT
jgi:signal transduction histidine kinase